MTTAVKNKAVKFINLGLIDYRQAWDKQTELFQQVIDQKLQNRVTEDQKPTDNYLIFCYHPHVFTLGKSGDEKNLLINADGMKKKSIDYFKINRGGDITYHGPGQIVGYPVLDLDNFFTDIHLYLRSLEDAVILTLAEYGVKGGRIGGLTGVWIDAETDHPRKICALGVKMSRWVTMHGFAFNVLTDLSYYNYIIPCGISDKAVTSLSKEIGYEPEMNKVEEKLLRHIADIFEMEIQNGQRT